MSASAQEGPKGQNRKRHNWAALLLAPSGAVVAALLVFLRVRMQPPTVAAYTLDEPDAARPLSRSDSFEMGLRPSAPIEGAVAGRAFLLRGDEVRPWDPPLTVARDGSIQIAGQVGQLFAGVPNGAWEVAVAVGRPEVLPTAPADVLRGRDAGGDPAGWHLVRMNIRLAD